MKHLSREDIRDYANSVINHHNLRVEGKGETDLLRLAQKVNVSIIHPNLETYVALPHIIGEKNRTIFMVQKHLTALAERRNLAHLFGHYFLHHLQQGGQAPFTHRCEDTSLELEADIFADELLLPQEALAALLRDSETVAAQDAASWFCVPVEAVERRMRA